MKKQPYKKLGIIYYYSEMNVYYKRIEKKSCTNEVSFR